MEAEIIAEVDGFYEIEKTTMADDALEAALQASKLVGTFVVKGGIRPRLTARAAWLHPRACRGHDQHDLQRQVVIRRPGDRRRRENDRTVVAQGADWPGV